MTVKKQYKTKIELSHADTNFYVWVLNDIVVDNSNLIHSQATLYKTPAGTKLEENIEVDVDSIVYTYVLFDAFQPNAKFALKIGNVEVYGDENNKEPATNHQIPHPKAVHQGGM